MAKIEVKDIKFNGSELFDDSEGFMDELNEENIDGVKGGTMAISILIDPTIPIDCPLPINPVPWTPVIL